MRSVQPGARELGRNLIAKRSQALRQGPGVEVRPLFLNMKPAAGVGLSQKGVCVVPVSRNRSGIDFSEKVAPLALASDPPKHLGKVVGEADVGPVSGPRYRQNLLRPGDIAYDLG